MPLSPDQAAKVLEGDLANLIQKVKDGRPLSQPERKRLEEIKSQTKEAASVVELSKALQVSRQAIYNWQKEDGAPASLNVAEWKNWLAMREAAGKQGTGRLAVDGSKYTAEDIADFRGKLLKEQHLRQKAERKLKEIQLAKEEQGWIPVEEAQQIIRRTLEPLQRLLQNFPKRYAVQANPNDPDQGEAMLRECVEDLLRQVQVERGKDIKKRKGVK